MNGMQYEFPDGTSDADMSAALMAENKKTQAPAAEPYDFTEGMSGFDKFAAGMGKSMYDTYYGVNQLFGNYSPEEHAAREKRDADLMNSGAGMTGNIVGHVGQFLVPGGVLAGAGKTAGKAAQLTGSVNIGKAGKALETTSKAFIAPSSIRSAAGAGAAYGVTQPGDKVQNTLLGGLGGGLGQGIANGLSKTIAPKVKESVKGLLDMGVDLTPGQILGGTAKRVEDALTSVPFAGDLILSAQKRSMETFNKATWDKVLAPLGKSIPDDVAMGREAFAHVSDVVSKSYDDLLPKLSGKMDDTFSNEMVKISNMVETLPESRINQFHRIMFDKVYNNFTEHGLANGASLKKVESGLSAVASKYKGAADADQRLIGDAIGEVKNSLRGMLLRQNPKHAKELKDINKSYAMMIRPENAGKMLGAEDGVFTGAQLLNSVKSADSSFNKRAFAKGNALMQDIAEPAKNLLGQRVPDSGTAFRGATMLSGGVGGLLTLPAAAGYTKGGTKLMQGLLTKRSEGADKIAQGLLRYSPLTKGLITGGLLGAQ